MSNQDGLFKLCKEVYRRTGWRPDYREVKKFDRDGGIVAQEFLYNNDHTPLYTSDYLLEKLPATIKNEFDGGDDYLILYKKNSSWYADYMGQFLRCNADTPLKALLKLTIALSEAGELK